MRDKRYTIKFRLYATAFGIFLILIIIALITNYYVKNAFKYDKLFRLINDISVNELRLRKAEKDYIHREAINPQYFDKRESKFLQELNSEIINIEDNIQQLKENTIINNLRLTQRLKRIEVLYDNYHNIFGTLEETIYLKGFKDFGLIGKMREQIHQVEDNIKQSKFDPQMAVYMLTLRRHEKDYLLRKDLKYRVKFDNVIGNFIKFLANNNKTSIKENELLENSLIKYQELFHEVINLDLIIGLNETQGLSRELNEAMVLIEKSTHDLKSIIREKSTEKINEAITTITLVGIIMSAGIVFLLFRLSRHVTKSIRFLQKYITRLGKGELPDEISAKRNDEIAEMIHSINILTQNLKNTRAFAIEVGHGNLQTKINVFDNKGDLGGALIEMRNRLAQVSKEKEKNEVEAGRRAWITEGIAKFANILRRHDDIEKLLQTVLVNLISYMNAQVGAIYVLNDKNKDNVFFELVKAVAYGKISDKNGLKVYKGENLIGHCIETKEIIHLKDIPENYIEIASGIGRAAPSQLLIAPFKLHENVLGVIELATFHKFKSYMIEFMERLSKDIAITITSVRNNQRTASLLVKTKEQAEKLIERQTEIENQKEVLQKQAESLQQTNINLEKQKEYTAASIRYAKTIQNAFLPPQKQIEAAFSGDFIIYRPKDIVSGDFYWMSNLIKREKTSKRLFAVVDCTGHGVPGAFMSLIGCSLLNEIINENEITTPSRINEMLNNRIITSLDQKGHNLKPGEKANTDGMDLCLCSIDSLPNGKYKVVFSGAKRPLIVKRQNNDELEILKADRISIGGYHKRKGIIKFTDQEITLSSGDILYLSTDGLIDQNAPDRKKFGSKRFIEVLKNIGDLEMHEQKDVIELALNTYQNGAQQRDDITIVGLKL